MHLKITTNLSREDFEQKVKKLGFVDANKGWAFTVENGRRLHIVPSDGYYTIHKDSKHHRVMTNKKAVYELKRLKEQLDEQQD